MCVQLENEFPDDSFIGVSRKYLMGAPELHKIIPARKLCNRGPV